MDNIVLISFVLVISFWCWLIYAIAASLAEYLNDTGDVVNLCPLGTCPTYEVTGEKKCPPQGVRFSYDPSVQVCEPVNYCQYSNSFAVNNDGSTNISGRCESTECRCLNSAYCPYYVKTYFQTVNGNAYYEPSTTFSQIQDPNYVGGSKQFYESSGIKIGNTLTDFCTIPPEWIYRSYPGCIYEPDKSALQNIVACMKKNPCNVGVLAFITKDASSFTEFDASYYPLACVPGKICTDDAEVTLYDINYGMTICRIPI